MTLLNCETLSSTTDSRALTFRLKGLHSVQEVDFLFTTETIIIMIVPQNEKVDTTPTRSEKSSSISRRMTADVKLLEREVIQPC